MRRPLNPLARDRGGVTIVEFAIVLPVLLLLICGAIETGHMIFARTVLEGAVTEAARRAVASQESTQASRDAVMREAIGGAMANFPAAPGRQIAIDTKVFADFSSAYPETFTDSNGNGRYDAGEPYVDRNRNGMWDNTTPKAGTMGGPGDVVSFTVRYPKRILFGFVGRIMGFSAGYMPLGATTVVRNESVVRK